jgi:hypothetical protein
VLYAGLVVPLLLLGACGSGGEASLPVDDRIISPSPAKDVAASVRPVEMLTGRLGFDDVEGGCAYLERDDGRRFEVLYPEAWRIDRTTSSLLGPDGQRIAAGGQLTVRGSIATGRSSICQLGPIFEASSVVPGAP